MNKSRFYLRITGRTGRSSNRKRGLCHTPPPTVVTSIWLLITSWILSFARKHLDTVEAIWIDYLPDYLLLKTYSPGAKCLHSFYLEVVSRIRVKQTRSRRLINYLPVLFWVSYFGHLSCRVSSRLAQNLPTICFFLLPLDSFSTILRTRLWEGRSQVFTFRLVKTLPAINSVCFDCMKILFRAHWFLSKLFTPSDLTFCCSFETF